MKKDGTVGTNLKNILKKGHCKTELTHFILPSLHTHSNTFTFLLYTEDLD